jgi:poly(3-hydroxybutyrate) depolymerase
VIEVSDQTTGYRYGGGTDGNEVWYYTVKGLGHSVPRKQKHGIDSLALVWEFFARH